MDYALRDGLVQHLLVPLLQPLWLRDLLVGRVTVEDVVVPLAGRTGPNVTCCVPGRRKLLQLQPLVLVFGLEHKV